MCRSPNAGESASSQSLYRLVGMFGRTKKLLSTVEKKLKVLLEVLQALLDGRFVLRRLAQSDCSLEHGNLMLCQFLGTPSGQGRVFRFGLIQVLL
jgi:hypothetical protein